MYQVIEHVFNQLEWRLMLDSWKDVPTPLVCFCLHAAMSIEDMKDILGTFQHDKELVSQHYNTCKEIIATMNVTITYKLAA